MSTKHQSSKSQSTDWTEWEWNEERKQWGRWRMRKDKYETQWQDQDHAPATQSTSKGKEPEESANEETRPSSQNNVSKDDATVSHARVVAHVSQVVGGISENHWSIYLLLQGGLSVRMNMRAGIIDDTDTGTLEFNEYTYQLTASALKYWDYEMVPKVTVKMVKDVIYYRGRDQYQFSGGGSGCRYWW
ncbi:hypothetical protein BKA61DRAFT_249115 [Leptodontidium sp. MPI-SDFR-AT-0119]|nr:hypothetical protein BKA61DRAFT_249115 [Leptodontidium sp. MPI-SDFR-AT-0119]